MFEIGFPLGMGLELLVSQGTSFSLNIGLLLTFSSCKITSSILCQSSWKIASLVKKKRASQGKIILSLQIYVFLLFDFLAATRRGLAEGGVHS